MSHIVPFQLMELNVISAQDLAPVSRPMKTYAVAWVHPNRKLTTRVDPKGQTDPSWNDKFVFRVDDDFLFSDTSAVNIEIYALHWFRDIHVGTVRILVSNLFPPSTRPNYYNNLHPQPGMRFVALQVRRDSGRPQGILNVGVGLLDSSMRSMPLYTHMNSSAVGYRDLMGEEEPYHHHNKLLTSPKNTTSITSKQYPSSINSKPELRRTKSDNSSMVASELRNRMVRTTKKPSSVINGSEVEISPKRSNNHKGNSSTVGSIISRSEIATALSNKEGKSDSTSEFDLEIKDLAPKKTPTHHKFTSLESEIMDPPRKEKPGKVGLLVDESDTGDKPKSSNKAVNEKLFSNDNNPPAYLYSLSKNLDQYGTPRKSNLEFGTPRKSNMEFGTPLRSTKHKVTPRKSNMEFGTPLRSTKHKVTSMKPNFMATPMKSNIEFGTPLRSNLAGRPILTESELGPSPSEVATQMAKERINWTNDTESSIISEWSHDDSSVEGLRSKLERWQTELPPLYDLGEKSSYNATDSAAATTATATIDIVPAVTGSRSVNHKNAMAKKHIRRHTDAKSGLFSCFSNVCGLECSIICGSAGPNKKAIGGSARPRRSTSTENLSSL